MRLTKLKFSGFKSFVDPTVVLFPSSRVGVVGPNGCGKSNIIDAVRWVMGESSAKTLRGATMADVIFNGSASRKPVGQASVELIFDNSEGRLAGEYSQYTEISIRRVVSRDGQSQYYLNGTRCRRRDVADIFMGTGLGARSYAIIGQNTISQIIEAKPEELRSYVEEAAGISKYKDRRKEAQSRMENTRDNLTRLQDIREELNKQVVRLERQAKAAQEYTDVDAQIRQLQCELDGMRWREWHTALLQKEEHIHIAEKHWQENLEQLEKRDRDIVDTKNDQEKATEHAQKKQALHYQLGIESARLKETMAHQQLQREQLIRDIDRVKMELAHLQERFEKEEQHYHALSNDIQQRQQTFIQLESAKKNSESALLQAEKEQQEWQKNWDRFQQSAMDVIQKNKILQTRIEHQEEGIRTAEKRLLSLEKELQSLEETASLENLEKDVIAAENEESTLKENLDALKVLLEECVQTMTLQREKVEKQRRFMDDAKKILQQKQGELTALNALQQTVLGTIDTRDASLKEWLEQHHFIQEKKLAQIIQVEPGWEKAVECVLEHWLHSFCVEDISAINAIKLPPGQCILMNKHVGANNIRLNSIGSKIKNLPDTLYPFLENIYIANNDQEVQHYLSQIQDHESIITPDGTWIAKHFIRWNIENTTENSQKNTRQGILQRERSIKNLQKMIEEQEAHDQANYRDYEKNQAMIADYEKNRAELIEKTQMINRQWVDLGAQIRVKKNQITHIQQRRQQLLSSLNEPKNALQEFIIQRDAFQKELMTASEVLQKNEEQKQQWLESKTILLDRVQASRLQALQDRELWHQQEMQYTRLKAELMALEQSLQRTKEQRNVLIQQNERHQAQLEKQQATEVNLQPQWESLQVQHQSETAALKEAEKVREDIHQNLKKLEQERGQIENSLRDKQSVLEKKRLDAQALKIKCENIENIYDELYCERSQSALLSERTSLSSTLPESRVATPSKAQIVTAHSIALINIPLDATLALWEEKIQIGQQKIKQLGPINLAALDEFKTESERKKVLDEQSNDLTKALETLEGAIRQIDEETKIRFQGTYEKINAAFQVLFPRLFGGGQATMELTHQDYLEAGVTIMAQPPGKRNSSIYLLSGGEKAMVAIALVFAIFQLNPSPFCMLDEVDAPLDDANVERFCKMVKEMSEHVQFIFITHNKITMELGTHLSGVTMHEPGVSRIVSVDIDDAISFALPSKA